MSPSLLREKIQKDIQGIPDDRTPGLYDLGHQFRLLSRAGGRAAKILSLAGSWDDMPENDFSSFCSDIRSRRVGPAGDIASIKRCPIGLPSDFVVVLVGDSLR